MTLESLFAEISDRGWLISNLFQLDDGSWQANLRTTTHHTEFARADSAILALTLCLDKIESAIESEPNQSPKVYSGPSLDPTNLRQILSRLKPTFVRRI